MPSPTVDDVLVAWRDVMADESKIVENVANLFEDADGSATHDAGKAACACFAGGVDLAALALSIDPEAELVWEAMDLVRAALPGGGTDWYCEPFTPYLRDHGHRGCAEFLDRVIVERRGEASDA